MAQGKAAHGSSSKLSAIITALVIAVVLIAVGFVALGQFAPGGGQLHALVHAGDGAVYELPLGENDDLTVTTDLGTNVVSVRDGAVFVHEADCDNQDCVHQGKVSAPGKQIICLPHKLWVEVVQDGAAGGSMDVNAAAGDGIDVASR